MWILLPTGVLRGRKTFGDVYPVRLVTAESRGHLICLDDGTGH